MTSAGPHRSWQVWSGRLLLVAIAGLLTAPSSFGEDAACKVALDAVTRALTTPNHQYISMTSSSSGGQPRESEMINTGVAMYVQVGGKWRTSPISPQAMMDMMEQNQKNAKNTACRLLREESVAGVAASVYSVHDETEAGSSDSILWISKADGLPLRQEVDMQAGAAKVKTHSEARFVYSGVQAPAVVE